VIELLQRLAREHGRAVVLVTHDPRILSFGDRIIHLEDGRIVKEETSVTKAIETTPFLEGHAGAQAISQAVSF
jgi:ABC-type cobalamin/Fe3+-siderophores transport system ATPase subunit